MNELINRRSMLQATGGDRPKSDRSAETATRRGIAYVKYELVRTYVGAVAEVQVNRKTGEIAVIRFHLSMIASGSSIRTGCAIRSKATSCRPSVAPSRRR
jgi:hypothetical protein